MLRILLLSDRERASPHLTEISVLIFVVKEGTSKLSGVSFFRKQARELEIKLRALKLSNIQQRPQ